MNGRARFVRVRTRRHRPSPAPNLSTRGNAASCLIVALFGAVSVAIGLLLLPVAAPSLAATDQMPPPAPKTTSVTITGPRMLDPRTITAKGTAKDFRQHSTVTVSVTRELTNQTVRVSWTSFTPSNLGGGFPYYQYDYTLYPVMVVECRTAHPHRISQCWQASNYEEQFGSNSNALYTTTASNGTGTVDLQVQNSLQNSWLGCDSRHPCSIAVVPSQGGIQSNCGDHSQDSVQALGNNSFGGSSANCAWAQRIVVPLTFGPVEPCTHIRNPDLRMAGSPLMQDAMSQWDTGLCRSKHALTVNWNGSIGEPTAIMETVVDGLADVALTTRPAASVVEGKRRYTYAPVGITAAALAFWFDNPNTGQPYTQLRLNQRLLAKMLTTSYTDYYLQCPPTTVPCDKAVSGNPPDWFNDPEFIALNKNVQEPHDALGEGLADVPIVLGGQSDLTYEVTRWIAGSPAATAFLNGKRDHWGMHVNARYRGIKYPIGEFTSRDPSTLLQAAYTPTPTLGFVTAAMLQGQPPGSNGFQPVACLPGQQQCYQQLAGEPIGQRALFGITDEADAATFLFPTAAIRNHAGRYVTPTQKSMAAALTSMTTAKNGVTQQVNLDGNNPAAYPLTMVVYAVVPISGVSHSKAVKIARWLDYVVGPGQQKGELPGELPFGYLPLPAKLRAEARHVATEVLHQSAAKNASPSASPSPTSTPSGTATPTPTSPATSGSPSSTATGPGTSSSPPASPTISVVGLRRPVGAGLTRYALPALLIIAGLAALLGASIGAFAVGPGALGRLRRTGSSGNGPRPRRRSR